MSAQVLKFHNTEIRFRDDNLCLTDLWRAAGADDNKRPALWGRQENAREFIDHMSLVLNVRIDHIWNSERGRYDGATWAHFQIALKYASYLSPETQEWVGTVVRAHIEGRSRALVPAAPRILTDLLDIAKDTNERVIDLKSHLKTNTAEIKHEITVGNFEWRDKYGELTDWFRKHIPDQPRRPPKAKDIEQHRLATLHLCDGKCPRCLRVKILDERGQWNGLQELDHRFGRGNVLLHEFWIICCDCHLETHPNRAEDRLQFDAWIQRVKTITIPTRSFPMKHRKRKGRDKNDDRTGNLL